MSSMIRHQPASVTPLRLVLALATVFGAAPAAADEDFSRLSDAAAAGSAADQVELAVLLDAGIGVPRDREQALLWYNRAALSGEARAQHTLGQLFETGDGVPRNLALAKAWYAAAAPAIPAAAARVDAIAAAPAAELAAPEIRDVRRLADGALEVVWTAPEQPQDARFLVEARLADGGILQQGEIERSAARLALDAEAVPCCVRVVAVDADRARYAASDWTALGLGADAAPPARIEVTVVHSAATARLAEDLAQDFEASGIAVQLEEAATTGGGESSVLYRYETDRSAAEGVASMLPSGFSAPERAPSDASAAPSPGRIEVRLTGSDD